MEYPYFNLTGVGVLIDTWWNVNVIDINYINEYAWF